MKPTMPISGPGVRTYMPTVASMRKGGGGGPDHDDGDGNGGDGSGAGGGGDDYGMDVNHTEANASHSHTNHTAELDTRYRPADPEATDATRQLFTSLDRVSKEHAFLFGHQNTAAKGQEFRDPTATHHQSDVHTATNDSTWAAVYGLNFWEVFNGTSLVHFVKSAYMKGAVIEAEWEADNPLTGGSASDCTGNPMNHITPGGYLNKNWTDVNSFASMAT